MSNTRYYNTYSYVLQKLFRHREKSNGLYAKLFQKARIYATNLDNKIFSYKLGSWYTAILMRAFSYN